MDILRASPARGKAAMVTNAQGTHVSSGGRACASSLPAEISVFPSPTSLTSESAIHRIEFPIIRLPPLEYQKFYQPLPAIFSSGFMLSQLMPTMASPRPVLTLANTEASL